MDFNNAKEQSKPSFRPAGKATAPHSRNNKAHLSARTVGYLNVEKSVSEDKTLTREEKRKNYSKPWLVNTQQ